MSHPLLLSNQKKRKDLPFYLLVFFSMFISWQMGYIYYMGPSLVIDGKTPLPIDMNNVTSLIAVAYILSIVYMIFLPKAVVWGERITASVALLSVLGLFLPLSVSVLEVLVYLQVFCCCFMIGFETFIITNYFTENTAIKHLTLGYMVGTFIAGFVQNEFLPLSFSAFRVLTVIMLSLMLVFFWRLKVKDSTPTFAKKKDTIPFPLKLFAGTFALVLVSCLMMLCGPTAVGEVKHGVFISYTMDALGSLLVYVLYKKRGIHPLKTVSVFVGISAIGFLMLFASGYMQGLVHIGCALIGLGYIPCQFLPLFGIVLMKNYPSRYIAPGIITIALVTVLIHSSLVEAFRDMTNMLNLVYVMITVILAILYIQLEPYLIYALQRKIPFVTETHPLTETTEDEYSDNTNTTEKVETMTKTETTIEAQSSPLAVLTNREFQVLELIAQGYSNSDIAKILVISEYTVNDHTKKIYRKLDVHNRHAAAQVMIKHNLVMNSK